MDLFCSFTYQTLLKQTSGFLEHGARHEILNGCLAVFQFYVWNEAISMNLRQHDYVVLHANVSKVWLEY